MALDSTGVARARTLLSPTDAIGKYAPSPKSWWLLNLDTGESLNGPFESLDMKHSVGSEWTETWALNRKHPITEFLHGRTEQVSFTARFYAVFEFQPIQRQVDLLKSWAVRPDGSASINRPPILQFWVGDQHLQLAQCYMPSVDVAYDPPGFAGSLKGASVAIQLRKYKPFALEFISFDTRYYRAKLGDTYEGIANREYKRPLLGIELRYQNPDKRILSPGDVIRLPSPNGSIQFADIRPRSIPLNGILDRTNNARKANLEAKLAARQADSIAYVPGP